MTKTKVKRVIEEMWSSAPLHLVPAEIAWNTWLRCKCGAEMRLAARDRHAKRCNA